MSPKIYIRTGFRLVSAMLCRASDLVYYTTTTALTFPRRKALGSETPTSAVVGWIISMHIVGRSADSQR